MKLQYVIVTQNRFLRPWLTHHLTRGGCTFVEAVRVIRNGVRR